MIELIRLQLNLPRKENVMTTKTVTNSKKLQLNLPTKENVMTPKTVAINKKLQLNLPRKENCTDTQNSDKQQEETNCLEVGNIVALLLEKYPERPQIARVKEIKENTNIIITFKLFTCYCTTIHIYTHCTS